MMDIPKWANYVAQDTDGSWYAFEYKPIETSTNGGRWESSNAKGTSEFIRQDKPNPENWKNTLIIVNKSNSMDKDTEVLRHIPNWANYIAQDADGEWNAFMGEPFIYGTMNSWMAADKKLIYKGKPNPDSWKETLRKVNKDSAMDKDIDMLQSITDAMKAGEDHRNFKWIDYVRYIWVPCRSWDEAIEKWLKGYYIAKSEPRRSITDQKGDTYTWPVPVQERPELGSGYYVPSLRTGTYIYKEWKNSKSNYKDFENGLAHETADAASEHTKALLAISRESTQ